jgi:integrase
LNASAQRFDYFKNSRLPLTEITTIRAEGDVLGHLHISSLPSWHGWHAARRGLGTNLYQLGVPNEVIQAILRHSNVNVTLGYYIKPQSTDVIAAMEKFEAEMAAQSLRDTNGTPNLAVGAMPKSVN